MDGWEATVAGLLADAGECGLLREGIDPARVSNLVFSAVIGQFELAQVHPEGPDLWERMNNVWLSLLPAITTEPWLQRWQESGWAERPRPPADCYRRDPAVPGPS
jgi:hypothetical protein